MHAAAVVTAFFACGVLTCAQRWSQGSDGTQGGHFGSRGGGGKRGGFGKSPGGFNGFNDCTKDNPMQCMQSLSTVITPPERDASGGDLQSALTEQCPTIQEAIKSQSLDDECCNLYCLCQSLQSSDDTAVCGGTTGGFGGFGNRGAFGKGKGEDSENSDGEGEDGFGGRFGGHGTHGSFGGQGSFGGRGFGGKQGGARNRGPFGNGFTQCQNADMHTCMQGLMNAPDFESLMPQPGQDLRTGLSEKCPMVQEAIRSNGLSGPCCNLDCMCQATLQGNQQVCGGQSVQEGEDENHK